MVEILGGQSGQHTKLELFVVNAGSIGPWKPLSYSYSYSYGYSYSSCDDSENFAGQFIRDSIGQATGKEVSCMTGPLFRSSPLR